MTNPVTARLNNLPCISAQVTHRPGASPTTAKVVLRAADAASVQDGAATLLLSDENSRVEIISLDIVSIEENGALATVKLADRRRSFEARITGERADITLSTLVSEFLRALGEKPSLEGLKRGDQQILFQRWQGLPVADALERLLAQFGQTYTVDFAGELIAVDAGVGSIDSLPVLESEINSVDLPGKAEVIGDSTLAMQDIQGQWEAMCKDENGALQSLATVLSDWGISDAAVREACLYDGGLRAISTGADNEQKARRAALLERYAYRCYRIPTADRNQLPLLSVRFDDSHQLTSARVDHTGFRPKLRNAVDLEDPYLLQGDLAPEIAGYHFDGTEGVVTFSRVVGHLEAATTPVHDTRLEGRTLSGVPTIRLLAASDTNRTDVIHVQRLGRGDGSVQVNRAEMIPYRSVNQSDGQPANKPELEESARTVLTALGQALPKTVARARIAGAHALDPQLGGNTQIHCDDKGLVTLLMPANDPVQTVASHFNIKSTLQPTAIHFTGKSPLTRRHINAYRLGPVLLRASGTANESESYVAAEAVGYDSAKDQLDVDKLAPIKTPYHLANTDSNKAGGWFLAAPVRLTSNGIEVLDDGTNVSTDYPAQTASELGDGLAPQGTEGLLLQGADGATFLALFDRPLVAQHRGNQLTDYSVEVRDITGNALDAVRRGGLQFPFIVSLSYSHRQENVGGVVGDRGWVPTLNLRDISTGTEDDFKRTGRGLFTETGGLHLGRLAHLPKQGGPLMADSGSCTKHKYGQYTDPQDGTFIETAGHISTDAFFKKPGDSTYDGPFNFQSEATNVTPPAGPEYRAEIKFDTSLTHPWNNQTPAGRWVVTYRWPFFDYVPDTWTPREKPPDVSEKNLALPSLDIVPTPSGGEPSVPITYPGPSIKIIGYAPEIGGEPDPSLGGGCVYYPSDLDLLDGAPWTSTDPQRFAVFHPKVGIAFGLPKLTGDGEPVSGFRLYLDGSNELNIEPVDGSGSLDTSKKVKFAGPVEVCNITPTGDASCSIGTDALRYREITAAMIDVNVASGDDATFDTAVDVAMTRSSANQQLGLSFTVANDSTGNPIGVLGQAEFNGSSGTQALVKGIQASALHSGSGTGGVSLMHGGRFVVNKSGSSSGAVSTQVAVKAEGQHTGAGTVTNSYGVQSQMSGNVSSLQIAGRFSVESGTSGFSYGTLNEIRSAAGYSTLGCAVGARDQEKDATKTYAILADGRLGFTSGITTLADTVLRRTSASNLQLENNTVGGTANFTATGDISCGDQFLAPDGTAGVPSHSFTSDTDKGMYNIGPDDLGFATAGALRLSMNTTAITAALPFSVNTGLDITTGDQYFGPIGTVGDPTYAFTGHTGSGMYSDASGNVKFAVNLGIVAQAAFTGADRQWQVVQGSVAAPGLSFIADPDTGFFTNDADTIALSLGGVEVHRWTTDGIQVPDGSAALPAFAFSSETNTGVYRVGASNLGISIANSLKFDVSATAVTSTLPYLTQDGTVGAPSLSFSGEATSGLYRVGVSNVGLTLGGTKYVDFGTTNTGFKTHVLPDADNTYDLGTSGTAWRNAKLSGTFEVGGNVGFYGTAAAAKPTVTGSRGGNAALASLLTGLSNLGLITDSTTA